MQAGQSIAVQGKAEAKMEEKIRTLKRGSDVYSKDVIITSEDGKVQIKFIDGGLINILPNTTYRLESYVFTPQESNITINVVEGGFRAMTGSIGKEHPTDYHVITPVATIGVRGTISDVLVHNGTFSVGVIEGEIEVENEGGSATVGPGQYLTTSAINVMSEATQEIPGDLAAADFTPPPGAVSLQEAQAAINANPIQPPEPGVEPEAEMLHIPESEGNPPC